MLTGPIPLTEIPVQPDLTGVAIGVFDGVHLGHRAVIQALDRSHGPIAVITFEPHPIRVVAPERAPARLTTLGEKVRLLAENGTDRVIAVEFSHGLMQTTAEFFFRQLLRIAPKLRQIAVGESWAFGVGRSGNVEKLQAWAAPFDVQVMAVPQVVHGGAVVSSTRIRELILQRNFSEAAELLGWSYAIEGLVVHGDARGRTIGFPTANLAQIETLIPPFGTYAARTQLSDGSTYLSVLNHGLRPTIANPPSPSVEVHLLDFQGDLYDQTLLVDQFVFLRPEQRFKSISELVAQIRRDCEAARGNKKV